MIISGGVAVKGTQQTVWSGTPATWPGWGAISLGNLWASYGELYTNQIWVGTVVDKLAYGFARLPLKVYQRADRGRPEARDHPYSTLLRRPNERQWPMLFWLWVSSTYDIYGESFLLKQRDRGGRPIALLPLHPTGMREVEERGGELFWEFQNGTIRLENIPSSDLVHPRTFNPSSTTRGLSKLERLRRTLEFEDAAQRAQSSFWRKGARPGYALAHPGELSSGAQERLRLQWDQIAAGADNTGTTVVLEEGMKPERLSITNDEAQYIGSRELNREEVIAAYDMPPPAVGILNHATFSNITEQFRSVYRDTQAPRCKMFEGSLELELRASVQPGKSDPDFGDEVYAEFLMDEVLRGDFETRQAAYKEADYMMVSEKRDLENLPFVPGTDRILVNSTYVPLDSMDELVAARARAGTQPADTPTGDSLPDNVIPMTGRGLSQSEVRMIVSRLGRHATLADVDGVKLVAGLNGHADDVLAEFNASRAVGESLPRFSARMKALGG